MTIMARIIRDIPTFGGCIRKGTSLAVVDGPFRSQHNDMEWYRPTAEELPRLSKEDREYARSGGLLIRELKTRSERFNLGIPATGQVVLSNVRKGREFELVEATATESEITFDDL